MARATRLARREWSVALFERSHRVGGRLFSVALPGIDHRIELGGMRFITTHRRVADLVADLGLVTHPFDPVGGAERTFLRGRFGAGADDASTSAGYALDPSEQGRSAAELAVDAFEQVIPGAATMDTAGFAAARATAAYRGRPLVDWSIGEAFESIRSADGHRYIVDAFGYDSGIRAFNAGDAIEFLLGGGDPRAEARTPDDGMDAIPRGLASRFEAAGGQVHLGAELVSVQSADGLLSLRFADGSLVTARRVVLALALPALRLLARRSPLTADGPWASLFSSVEGFPAMKLYLSYPRPWWRPTIPGIRTTTDHTVRKVFYVDSAADRPAALLAMYTDGRDVEPWLELAGGRHGGGPASEPLLAEIQRQLVELHPEVDGVPAPEGSAFQHWGADPHEVGWTFWSAGARSDDVIQAAIRPDPAVPVYIAGETFSRSQSWVEGALETAELVTEQLLDE